MTASKPTGADMHKTSEADIQEFVQKLVKDENATVSSTTPLFKSKIIDSMNILDLIGFVEKRLGRRLKDAEVVMPNFSSIGKIAQTFFQP